MPQQTHAYWYAIANSVTGSNDLADITDEITACNEAYWVARAYDQIRALYVALGSSPGTGVDGNFIVNQDNATSNTENSYLYFSRGSAPGGNAAIGWIAASNRFHLNYDITTSADIGLVGTPVNKVWATDIDVADDLTVVDLTITGTVTGGTFSAMTGTTSDTYTLDTDDTNYNATTGIAKFAVSRGAGTDAYIGFNEATDIWVAHDGTISRQILRVGDTGLITNAMFLDDNSASAVFEDTGGLWGTAAYAARSDHSHSGGTLAATGTSNTTWTIDDDYTTGSVNIEARFASSSNFIRYNPGGNQRFEFSSSLTSDTDNTDDLGTSGVKWRDLNLGRNALIGGTLGVTGVATFTTQAVFSQATGSSPFTVASTTVVANLNADKLDGYEGSAFLLKAGGTMAGILNMGGWTINMATGAITNSVITSPSISGGTITGSPTISGTPTFSGVATFSAAPVFSAAPSFSYAGSPFTVSNTTVVTNLNADTVDGIHGTALLLKAGGTMTGNLVMSGADIDLGGNDLLNIGNLGTHQSSHLAGGSDALAGALGSVTGTQNASFGVDIDGGGTTRTLHFGNDFSYYILWESSTSNELRVGSSGIHFTPISGGVSVDQDMGTLVHPWRSAYLYHSLILNQLSSPTIPLNGTIWSESGSPSTLRVRLGSGNKTIINSDNKTAMSGALASWDVPEGSAVYYNTAHTSYHYMSGAYVYGVSGSNTVMAMGSSGSTLWLYGDVRMDEGKKLYLDWDSNTYLYFDTAGAGSIKFYVNGSLRSTI